jgi:hypothetical protein
MPLALTVEGHQKVRNVRRDPRVAVTVLDPDEPSRYTGRPYSWYGGRDQIRVLLRVEADRIVGGF